MARGDTLRQLISDLRDELRRANSPAASPDDVASLRVTINHVYATLVAANDWPFLQTMFPPITLNAGQRFYDMPEGLDVDRITTVNVEWSGDPNPVERGIGFPEYADYDPDLDERTSPIMKWDIRFNPVAGKEQIEVWPLPDGTTQSLKFYGQYNCPRLVDDTDVCRLDGTLVVLYSAAELLPKDSPDKEAKLELAKELLRQLKLRGVSGGEKRYQMGLGDTPSGEYLRARSTVRIGR